MGLTMRIVSVLDRVAETIFRYNMVRPATRLGVAVSGGIDSVCLLDILRRLNQSEAWGLEVAVLHLNHQLRGSESDADETFVRNLAASAGLEFFSERATLGHGNLEQQARIARRQFFARAIASGRADCVATGHSRSDQAETVLFRLLRGTGLTGLSGVLPVTADGLIRPLLGLDRADIEQYAQEHGLLWRDDGSNADLSFARNNLRHQWLPRLSEAFNPRLTEALANLAEVARAEEDHWDPALTGLLSAFSTRYGASVVIPVKLFQEMDLATQRRLIRRLHQQLANTAEMGLDHVEAIRALFVSSMGDGRVQIPGLDVMRSFDWVRFAALGALDSANRFWSFAVEPGSTVRIPGAEFRLDVVSGHEVRDEDCLYNEGSRVLDANAIGDRLEVRSWRPGDRVNGHKVKQMFQDARIPLWERRDWPILAAGDEVLWTRRFGVAERCRPGKSTNKLLVVREFHDR